MRADRRLHLDRDQLRLVPETSPECTWLLAAKGHEIPTEMVKRLGLVMHEGRVVQADQVPQPEPAAVMPGPAVETTPEPPAAPAPEPADDPQPIMPPQSRRRRRK